jgi:PiT family inorganic phosphate transporter
MVLEIVVFAVLIVFSFDFFNGFHDAANAIATVVATKVLTPTRAVAMAAVGNFVGMVFITNAIAETIGKGIVDTSVFLPHPPPLSGSEFLHAMVIILAGVLGAIVWDIVTWWWGLPTSSSHALIGGLIGSTILAGGTSAVLMPSQENLIQFFELTGIAFFVGVAVILAVALVKKEPATLGAILLAGLFAGLLPAILLGKLYLKGLVQIVVFMVAAPFIGLMFAFLFTLVVMRLGRHTSPSKVNHLFKRLQLVSSFFYSVTHGTNDAQKGMGMITLILLVGAIGPPWGPPTGEFHVPFWAILGAHASISVGTLFGGWRIVRTMGQRVTALRPYQGFCAETGGGIALAGTALAGIPVSTTHVISSAIMGTGATRRLSAVRWGVARRIVWAWVLTIPASAGVAALVYLVARAALGL